MTAVEAQGNARCNPCDDDGPAGPGAGATGPVQRLPGRHAGLCPAAPLVRPTTGHPRPPLHR